MIENKYRVPVRIEFDGAVWVNAVDETVAEDIAISSLRATIGEVSDSGDNKIVDFVVDEHGITVRRDNESVEEEDEI